MASRYPCCFSRVAAKSSRVAGLRAVCASSQRIAGPTGSLANM